MKNMQNAFFDWVEIKKKKDTETSNMTALLFMKTETRFPS